MLLVPLLNRVKHCGTLALAQLFWSFVGWQAEPLLVHFVVVVVVQVVEGAIRRAAQGSAHAVLAHPEVAGLHRALDMLG